MSSCITSTPYGSAYLSLELCPAILTTKFMGHTLRYGWPQNKLFIRIKNRRLKVFERSGCICSVALINLALKYEEKYKTIRDRKERNKVKFSVDGEDFKLTFYNQDTFNKFKECCEEAQKPSVPNNSAEVKSFGENSPQNHQAGTSTQSPNHENGKSADKKWDELIRMIENVAASIEIMASSIQNVAASIEIMASLIHELSPNRSINSSIKSNNSIKESDDLFSWTDQQGEGVAEQ
ncbi:uncharacterized protein LOC129580255 isoform X1 [Sitodiplosis mosellana]|uniref:uncharacterized protein LOC129580255 isoform X1 n=1 Tax=Sitodiplosis mosellana TaxID=263140 RepID=UPI0024448DCD|nr:uncharacterized protein LOC129580255 isoform X1 [Sitodiplosis mosellana]